MVAKSDTIGSVLPVVVVEADSNDEGNHLGWEKGALFVVNQVEVAMMCESVFEVGTNFLVAHMIQKWLIYASTRLVNQKKK